MFFDPVQLIVLIPPNVFSVTSILYFYKLLGCTAVLRFIFTSFLISAHQKNLASTALLSCGPGRGGEFSIILCRMGSWLGLP